MAFKSWAKRKKPAAWDTTKSEYFMKWDAIKGEKIPRETLEFFIHVRAKLKEPFESAEDKDLFIHNVFSQTSGMEASLVRNSLSSQLVEQLLPLVNDGTLLQFASTLQPQIVELCEDQFASHVLQTLLLSATSRIQAGSELCQELELLVVQTSDVLTSQLVELACHSYGSHVVRTCLECVSGSRFPQLGRSASSHQQRWRDNSQTEVTLSVEKTPEALTQKLVHMAKAVKNYEGLSNKLSDPNFSLLVQLLLRILHARSMEKLSHKFVKRLCKLGFGYGLPADVPGPVPALFSCDGGLRLLEVTLDVCDDTTFRRLQRRYYGGRLLLLLTAKLSQISVQRLVESCPTAELLGEVLDELEVDTTATWWVTTRLPTALATACCRLFAHQGRLMKLAAQFCDCEASSRSGELAPCLLYRTTYSQWQGLQERHGVVEVSMDGSLLVQAMLKFSKPTRLISSLLSLRSDQMSTLLQSPSGSWIMDSLMASMHVGDKARTRLLETLKDELVPLACSKCGSRALGALWQGSNPSQRTFVAEVLAPHLQTLRDNFFGRIAVNKFALPLFVKKREDWTAYVKREANKRKMFADLMPTTNGAGPAGQRAGAQHQRGHTGPPPHKTRRKSAPSAGQPVRNVLNDLE